MGYKEKWIEEGHAKGKAEAAKEFSHDWRRLFTAFVYLCSAFLAIAQTGCATAGDLRASVGAKSWKLFLHSPSHGPEHSLSSDKSVDGGVDITLYNYCDRKAIHLENFEDFPDPGKSIKLVTASGTFSLKYLGMQMGIQAYEIPDDGWNALITAKWVKLTFEAFEKPDHFIDVNFDMTYFPVLIKVLDDICN